MISISLDLAVFLFGTFAAAFVTGLVGFAFGMVAAGVWLHALTPLQATTLIIAYALLVEATPFGSCGGRFACRGCCPLLLAAQSGFRARSPCWNGCPPFICARESVCC